MSKVKFSNDLHPLIVQTRILDVMLDGYGHTVANLAKRLNLSEPKVRANVLALVREKDIQSESDVYPKSYFNPKAVVVREENAKAFPVSASIKTDAEKIEEAAKEFPATFALTNAPYRVFRIERSASFVSEGTVWLYLYVQDEKNREQWLSYAKGTAEEIRRAVIPFADSGKKDFSKELEQEQRGEINGHTYVGEAPTYRVWYQVTEGGTVYAEDFAAANEIAAIRIFLNTITGKDENVVSVRAEKL